MMKFIKNTARSNIQNETEIMDIPVCLIRPNPYQPRKIFSDEAIISLARSIKEIGLLQPITVRKVGTYYELIAGERRLRATKLAGFDTINAIVTYSVDDKKSAVFAMIENLQRENLNFFEEAEGYQSLIKEHGMTQEELARKLSKNQSTIANKIRILKLSQKVKEKIMEYNLTERHARSLLRLHNEQAQLRLADIINKESLSVKETEKLVENELKRLYGEVDEPKREIMRLVRDYRIYINTIKRALNKINEMGVKTQLHTEDFDDNVCITIKLLK